MGASYRSVHLHHGLWRGEVQLQGKRYRTARCTTAKVAALLRDVLLYKLQNEAAPLQIGLTDSQKRWVLATNLNYLLQLVKSENDTLASLHDAAAGIEPTMLLPRLRTLSGERFSESPSDEMAFECMQDDEEFGDYGGVVRGNSEAMWGPQPQSSGSQALEALLSAAASAATQLQEEQTTQRQPSPPPLPPRGPSLRKSEVMSNTPLHQRADVVQAMSREDLQTALLEAYAMMDAMESQLTTLERQLGMRDSMGMRDTPHRLATRSSCTQPLQPLPPPPLPLYTASPMGSQPLPPASSTTAAQPPCRSVSMPARMPVEQHHPTTMQALVSTAALADASTAAQQPIAAPQPPIAAPQARPASVVAPPVPAARPPPAIAFRAASGSFQPYVADLPNPAPKAPVQMAPTPKATAPTLGCKRPVVEMTAVAGCVLPGLMVGDGVGWSGMDAPQQDAKRIRLAV